jgi:hypothetical protein
MKPMIMPTEYIVARKFEGTVATGEKMTLNVGDRFPVIGQFIATPTVPHKGIFHIHSQNTFEYFGDNTDGRGLDRAKLTWAIAYSPREQLSKDGHFQRFNEDEISTLQKKWTQYLREGSEVVLFNYDFYHASIEDLEEMAKDIHIKIKKN